MLTGLYFMCALAAVFVVVIWEIANDRVGLTGETGGLLRMIKEKPLTADSEKPENTIK